MQGFWRGKNGGELLRLEVRGQRARNEKYVVLDFGGEVDGCVRE